MFATALAGELQRYFYMASPAVPNKTGVRGFGVDASGMIGFVCPRGEHPSIVSGEATCVPDSDPGAALLRLPLGELSGLAAINEVNLLAVEAMFSLWGLGILGELREALADVRKRADGRPNPGDWVQGDVASQIVARVDATLVLINEER